MSVVKNHQIMILIRSPYEAQRNTGINTNTYQPRIALHSIRATLFSDLRL